MPSLMTRVMRMKSSYVLKQTKHALVDTGERGEVVYVAEQWTRWFDTIHLIVADHSTTFRIHHLFHVVSPG